MLRLSGEQLYMVLQACAVNRICNMTISSHIQVGIYAIVKDLQMQLKDAKG